MVYENTVWGTFLSRPNRFIAKVLVNGAEETVHVKNTGRCRELLVPGIPVVLAASDNPARKTKYDLVSVLSYADPAVPDLINMDSQAPNHIAAEVLEGQRGKLFSETALIRREVTHGDSRFDFAVTDGPRRLFIEVKGVTLREGGIALFPDAPTARGTKHLRHLAAALDEGYETALLFIVQMKGITCLRPNDTTDPAFGQALRDAASAGVKLAAVDCIVTERTVVADRTVPIEL